MELVLDRNAAEQRIWPAIDVNKSGTRKEEKLLPPSALEKLYVLRRVLNKVHPLEALQLLIDRVEQDRQQRRLPAVHQQGHPRRRLVRAGLRARGRAASERRSRPPEAATRRSSLRDPPPAAPAGPPRVDRNGQRGADQREPDAERSGRERSGAERERSGRGAKRRGRRRRRGPRAGGHEPASPNGRGAADRSRERDKLPGSPPRCPRCAFSPAPRPSRPSPSSALGAFASTASAADKAATRGLRFPSLTPDGKTVVFAWRGDIWRARRGRRRPRA